MNKPGIGVIVKDGDVEKALSIFKRKIKDSRLLVEYKESLHYVKPSQKRRKDKMMRRIRMKNREQNEQF